MRDSQRAGRALRRVLVTGGCGFIGSTLVRRLAAEGCEVRVLDCWLPGGGAHACNIEGIAGPVTYFRGDTRDAAALEPLVRGVDAVIHCAAQTSHAGSMTDPRGDVDVNVLGSVVLLEAVRQHAADAKVIFASTRQVYGRPAYLPVDEEHPTNPPDVNAISKIAVEHFCALYRVVHGIEVAVLRLTNVYGPGMRIRDARQMFLGLWIRQVLEGQAITVYGDGEQRRDLLHVDDAADALLRATRAGPGPHWQYNVGMAEPLPLNELAGLLVSSAGAHGKIVHVPFPAARRAIDIGDFSTNAQRIEAELGWRPAVRIGDGLPSTLEYYRARLAAYLDDAA